MSVEQRAGKRLGIEWAARFFVPAGTPGCDANVVVEATASVSNRLSFKREYYTWLLHESRRCNVLLLRYLRYDPFQLRFLQRCPIPVFLVHHTLEGPQIRQEGGRLAPLKGFLDELLVKRCHARAAGVIAVTEEIARYERERSGQDRPVFLYPNGIEYKALPHDEPLPADSLPSILFVASRFVDWHGLDKVVDAARASSSPFKLHVVGAINSEQERAMRNDSRFEVHGVLPPADVETLASRCSVGLGSFALFRKDMHQACTLKVREYLVAGLPVFSGHEDVFDGAFPYYRHGTCDIEEILAFSRTCEGSSRRQIADAARPWIDKEQLLKELHSELLSQLDFGILKSRHV